MSQRDDVTHHHVVQLRLHDTASHRARQIPPSESHRLLGLLASLNGQSLQTVFRAIELIESALEQVERRLRRNPDVSSLQQDLRRISAQLFAARMTALRLSANLAKARTASSPLGPIVESHHRLATAATIDRLVQRGFAALLR